MRKNHKKIAQNQNPNKSKSFTQQKLSQSQISDAL